MATELMSYGEIALLAQVERPVVTTWRRRHPDFPAPIPGSSGQPLFPSDAVLTWLLDRQLGNADADSLRAERAMHTLTAYAREHGGRRLVLSLGAALCLRHLAGRPLPADPLPLAERLDPDDEFLLTNLREAPALADLPGMVEHLIEGAYEASRAYQFLLGNCARFGWPELAADGLTPHLVTLIRFAADVPGRLRAGGHLTVGDPYACAGDLLAALLVDQEPEALSFNAAQPEPELARLVRRRLLLAGVPEFNFAVLPDDLNDEFADVNVIVTRLPYQPAELCDTAEDLARISDIADRLGPGCTAVVVGPAASLVDALRDADAITKRANLLTSGLVEAVVRLPGGAFPARPGHSVALWTLTRDPVPDTQGRLLLADLSGGALDQRVVETAAEDILLWRAEGHRRDGHDPRTGLVVPLDALDLRRGAALRPPGPASVTLRSRQAADRPALIGEVERRLADAEQETIRYAEQHGALNTGAVQRDGTWPRELSLGGLRTARRVRLLPGHRLLPEHVRPRGHHRVIGAAEVGAQSSKRWMDRLTLAAEYPHVSLTEPGDLVVTTVPQFGVFLDEGGFSVIEFPARGLRISPGDALTPRVLKALLDTARNTARSPGAVRGPRLRDVTIPDLSRDEAARLDNVLRRLDERERLLQRQAGLLAELRELAVTGFADGTLTTLYGTNS
ncbi:SAM-dependent DNA methyltransferase [Micromonospora sp. PSH03]|uniref:SAM-dependent DNA methyltransferase n=1 Tax=Micromonospora salmantinae TaxID=2911211 RepID=UPI001EE922E6|nr:SAM-dependent DNA methyltransferase [Micromonospora salmantinae]MCG5457770.1 SAM-dependent DNA methyltransferase [Micromonospora salmantinae]